MSACNFTKYIPSNQCIGDSLKTFNENFFSLDEGLCSIPDVIPGSGTGIEIKSTAPGHFSKSVFTKNSFVGIKSFDFVKNATQENLALPSGITIPTTQFSYTTTTTGAPIGTFSVIAPNNNPPEATVYWTADGTNSATVFATNSALSFSERGSTWLNGPVTSLLLEGDRLFVGGEFTKANGVASQKLAIIDLLSGNVDPLFGPTGSLIVNPLLSSFFGEVGTINCIKQGTIDSTKYMVFGGTFQEEFAGKSLFIYDTTNDNFYPFYVNGEVRSLAISGSKLFVGGVFDYLNYGATSDYTNRVYSNGVAKLSLGLIEAGYPNKSIDEEFAATTRDLFYGRTVINSILIKDPSVFLGGEFKVGTPSDLKAQNLTSITLNGIRRPNWNPIVEGPVNTLFEDEGHLYVGGHFKIVRDSLKLNENVEFQNVVSYDAHTLIPSVNVDWRPRFNGAVTSFTSSADHIYCSGTFTKINEQLATYIGAVKKASAVFDKGLPADLRIHLQTPSNYINNSLVRYGNSIIIGGNFIKINSSSRFYLARTNGVGESLFNPSVSAVFLDFGGQITNVGMNLDFDTNNCETVRVSANPEPYGVISATTFPLLTEGFRNIQEGQLCNFFIRRPGNSTSQGHLLSTDDFFKKNINILGIKLNFNKP